MNNYDMNKEKNKFEEFDNLFDQMLDEMSSEDIESLGDICDINKSTTSLKQVLTEVETTEVLEETIPKIQQILDEARKYKKEKLNLTNVKFDKDSLQLITEYLQEIDCPVTALLLVNCDLDDSHIINFKEILSKYVKIEELNLETNNISGEAFFLLFHALKETKLKVLRICNQSRGMTVDGEEALKDLVEANLNIVKVSYNSNQKYFKDQIDKLLLKNMDRVRVQRRNAKK